MTSGSANPNWRGDNITYTGAHERVRAQRGRASEHQCADCGQPACSWSYDHNDENEKAQLRKGAPRPFSTNPANYSPRCSSCHTTFDNRHLGIIPAPEDVRRERDRARAREYQRAKRAGRR